MQSRKNLLPVVLLVLALSLVLGACVPVTGSQPAQADDMSMMEDKDDTMMDEKDDTMMDDSHDDAMMDDKDDSMMEDEDDTMMDDKDDAMMEDEDDTMMDDKDDAMMDDSHDDDMMDDKDDTMMEDKDETMMMAPEWFSYQFTNVNNGETFTIADLKGKAILVETMATWCSNCLQQQKQVMALHDLLGERDDFVSFGLDIDLNEDADQLKNFVQKQGFDWIYAISSDTVAREIGNLYGSQFLNPPSTPMLIIDREGHVHPLPFGIKSAEDLQEALQPYLETSM